MCTNGAGRCGLGGMASDTPALGTVGPQGGGKAKSVPPLLLLLGSRESVGGVDNPEAGDAQDVVVGAGDGDRGVVCVDRGVVTGVAVGGDGGARTNGGREVDRGCLLPTNLMHQLQPSQLYE